MKNHWLGVVLSVTIFSVPLPLSAQGTYKPVVIKDGRAQQIKDNETIDVAQIIAKNIAISVSQYGAATTASGSVNNTAFQAAINAASSGSVITIPGTGNYTIAGSLNVGSKVIRWDAPQGATVNGSKSPELEGWWKNGPEVIQFTKGLGDPNVFTLGPGSFRQLLQTGAVGHFEASHIEADARNNGTAGKFIVGVQGIGRTDSSGNVFGAGGYAQAGVNTATTAEISGGEFNVDVRSPVVTRKTGLQIFDVDTSVGYGSVFDGALLIGRQSGGVGFDNGIVFGTGTDAQFPLKNGDNNALISAQSGSGTEVGYGLNLRGIKFRKSAISLQSQTLGQRINWSVGTSTTSAGEIRSDANAASGKIIFSNGGLAVQDSSDTTRLEIGSGGINTNILNTGLGVSTGAAGLELGGLRTGNGVAHIDFHGTTGTDFESRIIRAGGTNGQLELGNNGTGGIAFNNNGIINLTVDSTGAKTNGLSVTADTSPLDYSSSKAKLIYQHRDTANGSTNELIPGAVLQFNATGNGTVNSGIELSQTIWQGQFNYMRKTGDGSAHTYTAIGELGTYGPGAYNELGLFQGEGTNTGSGLGTMSGVEMLLKDSPNGGTTTYSTKMQAVVGRLAKYNPTIRKSFNFYASSEGSLPPNAILGANEQGLASWQRGFDFTDLNFTTGQFGLAPNNTFLAWQKANDAAAPVIGVNNSDDVFIAATSTTNRVNITDSAFTVKFAVDQDPNNPVLIYADGTLKRVTVGAPDSGGAGYRALRVAN